MDDKVVYFLSGDEKPVKLVLEGSAFAYEVGSGIDTPFNADRTTEQGVIYKAGASVAYNKMLGKVVFA